MNVTFWAHSALPTSPVKHNRAVETLSIGLLLAVFAPSPRISAQTSVERDQQALTIIAETVSAAGGPTVLMAVQDFTETGTVTYTWTGSVTGNITVKGLGLSQFRMDATLSEGRRSIVASGGSGVLTDATGAVWPVPHQSAADLGSMTLPYLPLIAAFQDSSSSIVYGGLVTQNGATAYDIRIQKVYTTQQDSTGSRGAREARDFYIDPNSFLVVAISDQIHLATPGVADNGIPHEILYSNYQPESGIMMPLEISETVSGAIGFTVQLTQVSFNSGLTVSDFSW